MKRRRKGLHVDTFPFLAVLLCAMGSLILLLLVLDRRAKVVALAKAREALHQAAARREQMTEAHRAEYERRRQALHATLAQQDGELLGQIAGGRKQAEAAAGELADKQHQTQLLHDRLRHEQRQLIHRKADLTERQKSLAKTGAQSEAARQELARMTADLRMLEQTLADLKALRSRQQQTYSLVPYQGRRGDNRKPLYVECTAAGPIFHPDKLALTGSGVTPLDVRREVERRVSKTEANAYLLMLVRPDGILTYYRTLASLEGLNLDFGYEFIDSGWVLDFPAGDAAPTQPWMTAARTDPVPPPKPNVPRVAGMPASALPIRPVGMPSGPDQPHADREAPVGTAQDGAGTGWPGPWMGSGPGGLIGASRTGTPVQGIAPGAGGISPGISNSKEKDTRGSTVILTTPAGTGQGGGTGDVSAAQTPVTTTQVGTGGEAAATRPGAVGLPPPVPQGEGGAEPGGRAGNRPQPPSGAAPSMLPEVALPTSHATDRGPAKPSPPAGTRAEAENDAGAESSAAPPNPLDRLLHDPAKKRSPPPFRLGSRDWIIAVECRADGVVLLATGQRLTNDELARGGSALPAAVRQMIARKQASVRAGELPYRPLVRFLVRPDGFRAYYLAYPVLEPLRLPMTRENLEADEDARAKAFAR